MNAELFHLQRQLIERNVPFVVFAFWDKVKALGLIPLYYAASNIK
jgi:hypothetical protein